ncbi:MAG: hypothetical protein Q9204_005506 [Flavoplaca sp. TL-2023a]
MAYSSYLAQLCSGLDYKASILRCTTIIDDLCHKKREDEFNESLICEGVLSFLDSFQSDPILGTLPQVRSLRDLQEATANTTASSLFENHFNTSLAPKYSEHKSRIDAYEERIRSAWGQGAYEFLPADFYNPTLALSQKSMQLLARLAEATSLPDGREKILAAIRSLNARFLELRHIREALKPYLRAEYPRGRLPSNFKFQPNFHVDPPNPDVPMDFSSKEDKSVAPSKKTQTKKPNHVYQGTRSKKRGLLTDRMAGTDDQDSQATQDVVSGAASPAATVIDSLDHSHSATAKPGRHAPKPGGIRAEDSPLLQSAFESCSPSQQPQDTGNNEDGVGSSLLRGSDLSLSNPHQKGSIPGYRMAKTLTQRKRKAGEHATRPSTKTRGKRTSSLSPPIELARRAASTPLWDMTSDDLIGTSVSFSLVTENTPSPLPPNEIETFKSSNSAIPFEPDVNESMVASAPDAHMTQPDEPYTPQSIAATDTSNHKWTTALSGGRSVSDERPLYLHSTEALGFTLVDYVNGSQGYSHNMSNEQVSDIAEGRMIVGDAIVQLLRIIRCPPYVLVVDPLDLLKFEPSEATAHTALGKASQQRLNRLSGVTKIILPYHDKFHQHWSLFEAHRTQVHWTLRHYDSLPPSRMEEQAVKTVVAFLGWLVPDFRDDESVKYSTVDCAPQNSLDCAVHVIVNAIVAIHGLPIPRVVNGSALRRELFDILSSQSHPEPNESRRRLRTVDGPDQLDSTALSLFAEDRFQKARDYEGILKILQVKQITAVKEFERRREQRRTNLEALSKIEQNLRNLDTSIPIYSSTVPKPLQNIPIQDTEAEQILENYRGQMEACLTRLENERSVYREQVASVTESYKVAIRAMAGIAVQWYVHDLRVKERRKALAVWKKDTYLEIKARRDRFAAVTATLLERAQEDLC